MEGGGGEGVHGPLLPVGTVFSLAGRMCSGQGGVATVGQAGLGVLTQAVCFSSLWQKWLFFYMWTLASLSFPHMQRGQDRTFWNCTHSLEALLLGNSSCLRPSYPHSQPEVPYPAEGGA